jgi:energy-converting hydrogenase Eha subunit C
MIAVAYFLGVAFLASLIKNLGTVIFRWLGMDVKTKQPGR